MHLLFPCSLRPCATTSSSSCAATTTVAVVLAAAIITIANGPLLRGAITRAQPGRSGVCD